MISRRIIRTKVMHILYAHASTPEKTINQSETELKFSIQKTYDLYHLLFSLLIELQEFASDKIEAGKRKNIPTKEDLNPNTRFIDNKLIAKLKENESLNTYLQKNKLSWSNHPELVRSIYNSMTNSELFKAYMASDANDFKTDRKLCDEIYAHLLLEDEDFFSELEEQSIYWNDDLDFVISMVLKTLRKIKPTSTPEQQLLSLYKDDEDREFTTKLFRKAILTQAENRKIIEQYTKNWDVDRVAVMDIIIMELALTELTEFPSIPIKVTLNEYIELSKYYSTKRSGNFINGVLDRITKDFTASGKIVKAGRGLLEG